MIERNAPITVTREFPDSGAPLRLIHKDLNIIKDLAVGEGLSLELALKSEEMFQSMMNEGKQEHDISAVLEIIEERSK